MPRYRSKLNPKASPKRSLTPLWLALAGIGLILVSVWAILGSTSGAVKGAPQLKVETDSIDRGNIKLGTTIRDDIRVTNVGDQPLRFNEAPFVEIKEGC